MVSSSPEQIPLDLIKSLLRRPESGFFSKSTKQDFAYYYYSGHHVFEFPASWSVSDWYTDDNFGACRIDKLDTNQEYFPSLKVLGTGEFATVNKAFFERFRQIISTSLRTKVDKVLKKEKGKPSIAFVGHSNGGAIAILATVWFLEEYRHSKITPLCITYGAPLVGDKFFGHALRREQLLHETNRNWASCFINVVLTGDLAPRILLSPRKDLQPCLESVFRTWEKKGKETNTESCEDFFIRLVNNAFAVASYDSCVPRSSAGGSSLLEAVKNLVELSPYRPFGSFHFCVGDGKLLRVDNHDAVLQILFYSLQLDGEGSNVNQFVQQRVLEHLSYESKIKDLKDILLLDNLNLLLLSPKNDDPAYALGLGTEGRLRLRAAGEMEVERFSNLKRVEGYIEPIRKCLRDLEEYRVVCAGETGYYDAFKQQKHERDFQANMHRLELVGHWGEVRELLMVFELPDSFEVDPKWVELGTRIRFLVEPIDIANFYRHGKMDNTGLYEKRARGRPNNYKYPENWLQHMRRCTPKDVPPPKQQADNPPTLQEWLKCNLDSCFWARVENMCIKNELEGFPVAEVSKFEKEVFEWLENGELEKAVLTQSPTFQKWLSCCRKAREKGWTPRYLGFMI